MKKLLLIILVSCGVTSVAIADGINEEVTKKSTKSAEVNDCRAFDNDQKTLKDNPGFYYYKMAICRLDYIDKKEVFEKVVELFQKSADNKYSPSYYVLGLLFENKYEYGSLYYGIKGKPIDLVNAIKNYEIAAHYGSSNAQNILGEIYLDKANLPDEYRNFGSMDIKKNEMLINLPNINKAVFWLEKAAKNGSPAAQGTLADLYRQGIGVPQDYVLAYVWENLSVASQSRFNESMQEEKIGRKLFLGQKNLRDKLYEDLLPDQKVEARRLLQEYSKNYFVAPNQLDLVCNNLQKAIALKNAMKALNNLAKSYEKLNKN